MKRTIVILIVVVILAVGGYFGYQQFLAPPAATPTPVVDLDARATLPSLVSAEGFVVPATHAELAFRTSGHVVDLPVNEGDTVEIGQKLIQLDDTDQQSVVIQARASVAQAEAGIVQAEAAVEQARAGLASAQAQLAQVKAGPTQETIAQAEAAVNTARAQLAQTLAGTRPEDVDAAASSLLKAEAALRNAQADYDEVSWADTIGESPQALALEQATLDYQAAKAAYDKLVNGATQEEIAIGRAAVAEAEAALATAKAGATDEEIAIAEAGVVQADKQVDEAEAAVIAAQASLDTAQANLETAEKNLADYTLDAPIAGTVSRIDTNLGEFVAAGTPILSLGDNSTWYVDTDDLSEIDVVQVVVGQDATVSIDAIPDRDYHGTVVEIAPRSETKRGDVTYTVRIKLTDAQDAPLRWGMTAFVDIDVD